jgi:hypothetical protein
MEVVGSSEILISMYRTLHIPEDCYLNFHCPENLSFNIRMSLAYVMQKLLYNKPRRWKPLTLITYEEFELNFM